MNRWFPVETERLILREFGLEDEHDVHAYASDPETVHLIRWGPNTPEMTRAHLEEALKAQEEWPRQFVELAIELRSDQRVIGSIALRIKDEPNRAADIGYILRRDCWRKGYVTEAARAILEVAFDRLKLHRVWATCDPRNNASFGVMEKIGMRREGHLLKNALEKGEWRDSYVYAILAEEWLSMKSRAAK